jgi:hypothetical protein
LNLNQIFCVGNDRLPPKLVDGVRYKKSKLLGEDIKKGIAKKRAAEKEKDPSKKIVKRAKGC